MNKLIVTLILSSTFAGASFAQEIKIITVDMGTLYSGYYKTQEANEKLKGSIDQAQTQAEGDHLQKSLTFFGRELTISRSLTNFAIKQNWKPRKS